MYIHVCGFVNDMQKSEIHRTSLTYKNEAHRWIFFSPDLQLHSKNSYPYNFIFDHVFSIVWIL
jgi:hypothetical protein